MEFINKVKKYLHKHKLVMAISITIFIALLTLFILVIIIPKSTKNSSKTAITPSNVSKDNKAVGEGTIEDLTAKAPTDGDLQYEFIKVYYIKDTNIPKYIYYTPEFLDDRLIQLNDQIIASLKQDGKINDDTMAYSICYFNDKTVADTYFEKISDPKTSSADKLKMVGKYIAIMNFSTNPKVNQLIKVSDTKTIKQY